VGRADLGGSAPDWRNNMIHLRWWHSRHSKKDRYSLLIEAKQYCGPIASRDALIADRVEQSLARSSSKPDFVIAATMGSHIPACKSAYPLSVSG
jgi:glucan phosphoethanolaminetransferase (alkaline phosphatase superfamily)